MPLHVMMVGVDEAAVVTAEREGNIHSNRYNVLWVFGYGSSD